MANPSSLRLNPVFESLCGSIPRYSIPAMSGTFSVVKSPFGGALEVRVPGDGGDGMDWNPFAMAGLSVDRQKVSQEREVME